MYHLTPALAGSREQSFALQAGVPLGVWHRVKTMNRVRALQTPRTEVIHNRSYLKTLSNWSRSRPHFLMNEWINTLIYRDPTFPLMSWFLAAVVRKSAPACVRAQSQTGSWWVLDVRAVPGLWYRLWSPWTGSQGATVLKRVWKNLNFVSVFFLQITSCWFLQFLTSCKHWGGLQLSVKWFGWEFETPSLRSWFPAGKPWIAISWLGVRCCPEAKRGLVYFHRKMEHDRDSRCSFSSNADCCSEEGAAQ